MEAERQGGGGEGDPKGAMKRYLPLTSALLRTLNPQGAKVTAVGFGRMVTLLFSTPPPKKSTVLELEKRKKKLNSEIELQHDRFAIVLKKKKKSSRQNLLKCSWVF